MKLNQNIRSAFIRAAMNDVPMIDYQQQAIDIVQKTAIDLMPAVVKAIYGDPETTDWVKVDYVYLPGSFSGVRVPVTNDSSYYLRDKTPNVWKQLEELARLHREQNEQRKELESKLSSVANSVTTRKALIGLLPEFEKYLPQDETAAIKTLPAVANVVSDFMKAGWPKGETPCIA